MADALYCPKKDTLTWGNEVCDSFAILLRHVCHDVGIKPHLQPLQGQTFALESTTTYDDDARLDINDNGFWEFWFTKDTVVWFFYPLAKKCPESRNEAYKYHESGEKNNYEHRSTDVEKATCCQLSLRALLEVTHQLQQRRNFSHRSSLLE